MGIQKQSPAISLLSSTSVVQSPFITIEIAGIQFGTFIRKGHSNIYPNYVQSIEIDKVNGAVNSYKIQMIYAIRAGDDPNFIDKVLSKATDRRIKISYGDYSLPSFIYKEEEAVMT